MPHLVIERLRRVPDIPSISGLGDLDIELKRHSSPGFALLVEVADLIADILFVLGSICFFPAASEDTHVLKQGCEYYVAGSVVFAFIALYALAESVQVKGFLSLESCENCLYVVGSALFVIGTLLFWPKDLIEEASTPEFLEGRQHQHLRVYLNSRSPQFEGSVLCICACLLFALAAFVNSLNIRHFNDVSSQQLSAVTSFYMIGSLLFVMGSVAFLPDYGCSSSMVSLGAWMYTIGSILYICGTCVSLVRTMQAISNPEWASGGTSLTLEYTRSEYSTIERRNSTK